MTIYRYPEKVDDYPGKVIFTSIIEPGIDVSFLTRALDSEANEDGNVDGTQSENQPRVGSGSAIREGDSCVLYLPSSLDIKDAVSYNNVNLGTIGGAAEEAIRSGSSAMAAVAKGGASAVTSFIDQFKTGAATDAAKVATTATASKFGAEIGGAVKSQTRVTTNPNTRALFDSVQMRTFSFAFKLIPQSATEAEEIKRIIKFFRTELYPEEIRPSSGIDFSLGYKFPNKFNIQFIYGEENEVEVATKLKPCYLDSFSANYNATSMSMHSDGNFSEVDISMSFMEARALSRKDIAEGY